MTKRRVLAVAFASTMLIVIAGFAVVLMYPFSRATRDPALLNATWGMSPAEVEHALAVSLSKDVSEPFFDINDTPIANRDRFSSLGINNPQFSLWNYQTTVYFSFFDNKLSDYKVRLTSVDSTGLDSTVVSTLASKYGYTIDSVRVRTSIAGFLHQRHWNSDLVRVEYWMFQEEHGKFDPDGAKPDNPKDSFDPDEYLRGEGANEYVAMIRVTYLPIEREVSEIGEKEKKSIF